MGNREIQRTYRGNAQRDSDGGGGPTDSGPERALVMASIPSGDEEEADRLEEISELLRTAGVEVAAVVIQHRPEPDPRTYLGRGKIEEVIEVKRGVEPDVIVAESELSPRQQRILEDRFGIRVVDRTAVILDIFALHATTAEGKLQVELAQLEYYYARQEGLWQHLERLGGGVGTRGPGESQLESDRRLIRSRMAILRRRLADLERSRGVMSARRRGSVAPSIALAGYTNAGKSTLMNALTGAGVSVNDALFETLDPTVRTLERRGLSVMLADTVGFIRHLPHQLVAAFRSTLAEVREADLILHVADASAPERRRGEHAEAVETVLDEISAGERPRVLVLNKIDLLDPADRDALARRHPDAHLVSSRTGEGLDALRDCLFEIAAAQLVAVDVLVPYHRGDAVNLVYSAGRDVVQTADEEGSRLRALLPAAAAARLTEVLEAGPEAPPEVSTEPAGA